MRRRCCAFSTKAMSRSSGTTRARRYPRPWRSPRRPAVEEGGPGRRARGDRRGVRVPGRLVGAGRSDLHVRRGPRRVLRAGVDPAARHRRRATRPDGLCARRLRPAAHSSHAAGLAARDAVGRAAGRAARNRRSRTVFGVVGHGERARPATSADVGTADQCRIGPARRRDRRRLRPVQRAAGRVGVRTRRGSLVPRERIATSRAAPARAGRWPR